MARVIFTSGPASDTRYVLRGAPMPDGAARASVAIDSWKRHGNIARDIDTVRVYLPNAPQTAENLIYTVSIDYSEER